MFNKILVALDGSEHSSKALSTAIQLAVRCESELVLFHAVQVNAYSAGYSIKVSDSARKVYEAVGQEQANAILGDAEILAKGKGVSNLKRVSQESRSVAKAILEASRTENAELIVIGTRGLTGLREMAMGSVAHKVSASADCPVLIDR